jgi:branched-chain amino acid transport system ATP-binding protein
MLAISKLHVGYGAIRALKGISLQISPGEIVALIGANGAGKSTTLKAISGILQPSAGEICFDDRRIDGLSAERVVRLGIAHVPEGRRVFPGLSVFENLQVATAPWYRRGLSMDGDFERVYNLFPVLRQRRTQLAWSMSGGEQQMLVLGRALMSRPKILLLDEPSLGLAPVIVERVYDAIREIRKSGIGILLVEQNAYLALETADRAYIISNGEIVQQGPSAALLEDPTVHEAYLGAAH